MANKWLHGLKILVGGLPVLMGFGILFGAETIYGEILGVLFMLLGVTILK